MSGCTGYWPQIGYFFFLGSRHRSILLKDIFPVGQFKTTERICTEEVILSTKKRHGFGTAHISLGHLRTWGEGSNVFTTVGGLQWEEGKNVCPT